MGVHPLASYPDGILRNGMMEILPVLARLCGGDVVIADGSGRCMHRVDRDGVVFPAREGHSSAIAAAVSRTRTADWEIDEATGAIRLAFPVGNWILEIIQSVESPSAAAPSRSGTTVEFGLNLDAAAGPGKQRSAGRGVNALSAKYDWDDIVGDGPAITTAIVQGKAAARSNAPVFLIGESGTGKELFAQAIHNTSSRRSGPFREPAKAAIRACSSRRAAELSCSTKSLK
jgi:hypothetical protein